MITKCHFCDYHKETPLAESILKLLAEEDMPTEDYILWFQRMIAEHGTGDWNSVKIHMGRMHKAETYYGIWPVSEYSESEKPLMNRAAEQLERHHAFNSLLQAGSIKRHKP